MAELKIDILNPSPGTKEAMNYIKSPDDVASGNRGIPPTVQAVEGQNSSSATKLLIENEIVDSGAANGTPVVITNSDVTLDGSNNLVFDGATTPNYLQMPAANFTATFALLQEWKVDLWVYPNTTRVQSVLLGSLSSGTNSLGIRIEDGNRLTAYYNGWTATNTQLSTAGTIVNNTWHFITIEKWLDGSQWKVDIYIDGTKQTSHSVSDFALYTTSNFYVGHNETDRGFLGSVNKPRVNNKAEHFGVNFTPSDRVTAYTTDEIMYDVSATEQTTPSLTNLSAGRNSSNEPIEISTANERKSVVYDLGNTSGGASIDYSTNPATLYTAVATAAITGWTFAGYPTNFPFKLHVTGNFDITYGTDGTGNTANQDGLKVFDVEYDGTNYQMSWENQITDSTDFTPALITQNAQTGTTYTFVLTDINKLVTMSNASANALTVPLNASVAYSTGTPIAIQMIGVGVTTISGDTGVTINGISAGSSAMAQYQTITLVKIATDTWLATGGTFA